MTPEQQDNADKIQDLLRRHDELAREVGLEDMALQDSGTEIHDIHEIRLRIDKLWNAGKCLEYGRELAALTDRPYNHEKALARIRALLPTDEINFLRLDLQSDVVDLQRAESRYVRERQLAAELRHGVCDAATALQDAQAIRAKDGLQTLLDKARAIGEKNWSTHKALRARYRHSAPESVKAVTDDKDIKSHMNHFAESRRHVAQQMPYSPWFIQKIHSDAAPVGDPRKPAIVDASYIHDNRYLLSVAWPDCTPEAEFQGQELLPGFHPHRLSRTLEALFKHYGIETSGHKTGHDKLSRTSYVEMDVKPEDYYKGRLIIDRLIRSPETRPQALFSDIDINLQNAGHTVPERPGSGLSHLFHKAVNLISSPWRPAPPPASKPEIKPPGIS